ncbi:MAG: thioredoxin family protein [Candidatus Thorarchaeota archaeon]
MIEKHDINILRKNGITIQEYMDSLEGQSGEELKENYKKYSPKADIVKELAEKSKDYTFVVFSAVWCKDCKTNIAAFARILDLQPKIDAIFFKGIKSAPLDPNIRWKVPPSPAEVNDFDLIKIPTFYILNKEGKVVTQMVENPENKETLEEELLYLIENL